MDQPARKPPVLIALPKGAMLSGITTWAANLAPALAELGHRVRLLVHATPAAPTLGPLEGLPALARRRGAAGSVEAVLLRGAPPIDDETPEPRPEVSAYVLALRELAGDHAAGPVVAFPTYSAQCAGLFAAASREVPGVARCVGWMHNHIPYDLHTLRHYQRFMHRFVAVSRDIARDLADAIPRRAGDVVRIPYGVEVPTAPVCRAPLRYRPLRIVSTGRIDREQKRAHALIDLSRELARRAIAHEVTLVGEGPASGEIDARAAETAGRVRRVAVEPHEVAGWLDRADVFVLASRYEGLSVSMLEAMARGCVPVVTRVSGAPDAVEEAFNGPCGVVVGAGPSVEEPGLGAALAEGVIGALETGLPALSRRAHARALRGFSTEAMAREVSDLCVAAAREPARDWGPGPASPGDFTVPPDAAERFARVLEGLPAHARIALWGAGRHTRRLLGSAPALNLVAILDDQPPDPPRELAGVPIIPPGHARASGVTDVIISSALHEPDLWARRGEIERQGAAVHRLYAMGSASAHA